LLSRCSSIYLSHSISPVLCWVFLRQGVEKLGWLPTDFCLLSS
jgi:hypothetical protein